MIEKYHKRANIVAGVWLLSIAGLVIVMGDAEENIWEKTNLPAITTFLTYALSMFIALWYYAKAKGYSGLLGISLFFLSVFGLFVLMMLRDRAPNEINET